MTTYIQTRVYPRNVPLDDALPLVGTCVRLALPQPTPDKMALVIGTAVTRTLKRFGIVPVPREKVTKRKARFVIHVFLSDDRKGKTRTSKVLALKGFKAKRERKVPK